MGYGSCQCGLAVVDVAIVPMFRCGFSREKVLKKLFWLCNMLFTHLWLMFKKRFVARIDCSMVRFVYACSRKINLRSVSDYFVYTRWSCRCGASSAIQESRKFFCGFRSSIVIHHHQQ